jgi:hypothetical protein
MKHRVVIAKPRHLSVWVEAFSGLRKPEIASTWFGPLSRNDRKGSDLACRQAGRNQGMLIRLIASAQVLSCWGFAMTLSLSSQW